MNSVYLIGTWANLILMGLSLSFCLAWPRSRGKRLLIAAMACAIGALLTFQVQHLLLQSRHSMLESTVYLAIGIVGTLEGIASHALMLAFVIAGMKPVDSGVVRHGRVIDNSDRDKDSV